MGGREHATKKSREPKKRQKKIKPSSKLYTIYKVQGGTITRTNRTCPKCGAGVFMANHKDRTTCGKCGYMEKR